MKISNEILNYTKCVNFKKNIAYCELITIWCFKLCLLFYSNTISGYCGDLLEIFTIR